MTSERSAVIEGKTRDVTEGAGDLPAPVRTGEVDLYRLTPAAPSFL